MAIYDRFRSIAPGPVQGIAESIVPGKGPPGKRERETIIALQFGVMKLPDTAQRCSIRASHCNGNLINHGKVMTGRYFGAPALVFLEPYSDDFEAEDRGNNGVTGLMEGGSATGAVIRWGFNHLGYTI